MELLHLEHKSSSIAHNICVCGSGWEWSAKTMAALLAAQLTCAYAPYHFASLCILVLYTSGSFSNAFRYEGQNRGIQNCPRYSGIVGAYEKGYLQDISFQYVQ